MDSYVILAQMIADDSSTGEHVVAVKSYSEGESLTSEVVFNISYGKVNKNCVVYAVGICSIFYSDSLETDSSRVSKDPITLFQRDILFAHRKLNPELTEVALKYYDSTRIAIAQTQ